MRWERVDALIDRAPRVEDLRVHGLDLVAAQRLRARGEPVAPELAAAERLAAAIALSAPVLLRRARAAYDGRMALLKGPEIAVRYPDPAMRTFCDIDLLVDDAPAAHRALRAAGFEPAGLWSRHAELHHLQPLCWPGLPITIELHVAVHFPAGLRPPAASELLAGAVPARFAGGIVDTLAPAQHTLVVAAHAWAHGALGHLGRLIDVALLAAEVEPATLDALAARWGCGRLWRTTRATIAALFEDGAQPAALRVCGPHLRGARERTLLERHVAQLTGPGFGLPPARAAAETARVLGRRILPAEEESWGRKLARTRRALRHRRLRHSEHEACLPPEDLNVGGVRGLEPTPVPHQGG